MPQDSHGWDKVNNTEFDKKWVKILLLYIQVLYLSHTIASMATINTVK